MKPALEFYCGGFELTVAPFLIVTPVPMMMNVEAVHLQAVPETNVTFVSTTGSPIHSVHVSRLTDTVL